MHGGMTTGLNTLPRICPQSPLLRQPNHCLLVPKTLSWDQLTLPTTSLEITALGICTPCAMPMQQDPLLCHTLSGKDFLLPHKLPSLSERPRLPARPFPEQVTCQGPPGSTFHLDPSPQGSSPPIRWSGLTSGLANLLPPSLSHTMVSGPSIFSGGERSSYTSPDLKRNLLIVRRS